jgi:hypothetical protein
MGPRSLEPDREPNREPVGEKTTVDGNLSFVIVSALYGSFGLCLAFLSGHF